MGPCGPMGAHGGRMEPRGALRGPPYIRGLFLPYSPSGIWCPNYSDGVITEKSLRSAAMHKGTFDALDLPFLSLDAGSHIFVLFLKYKWSTHTSSKQYTGRAT